MKMKNIYLLVIAIILPFTFINAQTKVYPPELSSPENGAIDQMPDVVLDWKAVTGESLEIFYEVEIDVDSLFENPQTFPLTEVTALTVEELMFGDKYYWRVRAHDGDNVSDWSEVWSFTVLDYVTIEKPNDGSEVSPQVTVEWDEITGVDTYQILVDTVFEWQKLNTPFESNIRDLVVMGDNEFAGVGDDGLVFHYGNGQWDIDDIGTTKDLYGLAVLEGDPPTVWVVGKSGTVFLFEGDMWTSMDIGTSKDLNSVYFDSENDGWIVGKSGVVFHYDGSSWTLNDTITSKDLYAVWALAPDDVWAAGNSGTFIHYNGTDWTVDNPGSKDYQDLWFNSPDDGWAVAKSGRYAHWDGATWTEENIGVSKILYSVAFNGPDEGYIVGQSGKLFKYDNGEWVSITSGTTDDIYSICFNNGNGLYGGKNGGLYQYTGGGFNSPYAHLYSVSGDETSYYLNNLIFGKTYYFKMRAAHSKDTTLWSQARAFRVQASPELLSPNDGATDIPLRTELDWKDFEGVLKYNVAVADNPDFNNAFVSSTDVSSFVVNGLGFGKDYYWRVNAQHGSATSEWSEPWKFTTVNTVNLVSPDNGATGVDPCPMLKWDTIPGAQSYEVWLDSTENFENALVRVESSDHVQCQSSLEKGKMYYWKVRAIYALDTSDFSPVWNFKTKEPQGIEEEYLKKSLNVYPNPSNGNFNLRFVLLKYDELEISVTDVLGKVIYHNDYVGSQGENKVFIDLYNITPGIYYVNISGHNYKTTRKITVK